MINNGTCDDIDFSQFKREVIAQFQNLSAKYDEDIRKLNVENSKLNRKVNVLTNSGAQSLYTVQTLTNEVKILKNNFNETKVNTY